MLTPLKSSTLPPLPVDQFYQQLLDNSLPLVIDVREQVDFQRNAIEGRAGLKLLNLPLRRFTEAPQATLNRIPAGTRKILTVCAHDTTSQIAGNILKDAGYNVQYLQNGMQGWGNFYNTQTLLQTDDCHLLQVIRPARGDLSYVLISRNQAAIIDPLRHLAPYQAILQQYQATPHLIIDTHAHADHISGAPQLAQPDGSNYYLHPYDAIHPVDMLPMTIPYTPLADGQTLTVGALQLKVIWIPGHTLGQINLWFSLPNGATYLFSGDGLFFQSFGRPDLGAQSEQWSQLLYESLSQRLPPYLSDKTIILPAHFATLSEDDGAGQFQHNYAWVKAHNTHLQYTNRAEFLKFVAAHLPAFPKQYLEIKRINAGLSHPTPDEADNLELGKNACAMSN